MQVYHTLDELYENAPTFKISKKEKYVIFSDLHMGNCRERDDFKKNSKLFNHILKNYYYSNDYHLILNGDIEELQKFSLQKVMSRYGNIYSDFIEFARNKKLYKIIGNHDFELDQRDDYPLRPHLYRALKFKYKKDCIFIFHGHQASHAVEKYNALYTLLLRFVAKPLLIKNASTAYDSKKKFKVEKKVYNFSNSKKIVSIIGHTHRPLFESLSKVDSIQYKIEQLCRIYTVAGKKEKKNIEKKLRNYKRELEKIFKKRKKERRKSSLYNTRLLIPSLFNSGCGIGKRGITSIEIANEKIFLVYWFHKKKNKKYLRYAEQDPQPLGDSGYYRIIIKEDYLDYIFTRIRLLN
jgi:predicted phosphodiesterase